MMPPPTIVKSYASCPHFFELHFIKNKIKWKWTTAVLVLLLIEVNSFYALGDSTDFKKGQKIDVEVAKMFSLRTQLSYEYYSLPFCLPKNGTLSYKSENLGEMLRGDIIVNTPYEVAMAQNISCKLLCDKPTEPMTWKESYSSLVIERIQQEYIVYLLIDDFTAANLTNLNDETDVQPGYYLGGIDEKNRVYINNYLKLKVAYHKYGENKFKVVGFIVEALSVDYKQVGYNSGTCNIPPQASPQYVNPNGTKILFFYSVEWKEEPDISWASRWDIYVMKYYVKLRSFNFYWLTLSLILYSGMTFVLLYDQLGKDITRYNNCDSIARLERGLERTEWNLLYADVFRPPTKSLLFAAVIGSGIQVFVTIFILVFFFMLGIFQSASRGAVGTCAIYCFSLSGLVAGYFSGRLYKTMQGKRWKKAAFLTATLYPSIVLGTYLFFNFISLKKHDSRAVLFSTMKSLLCVWFGISLSLVYVGYYFGYHKNHLIHPVRTKQKPSKIPNQVWYLNPIVCMVAGILPFSIVTFDLFYITAALWNNYLYVVSEFSFIIFIYLVIFCSETSMFIVYFQLRNEDYRWWWRCFMYSGTSAAYIMAFSIHFFFIGTNITELVPTLMYFVYMSLIAITFWLLTGTISFFAAFIFIRKIYAVIKIA